jgi:sulfur carrier protein ThiS
VAKIFDIAEHAGLTPRTVLDVVNGKPVNEDAQRRVAAAIAELGQPDRPVGAFRHLEIVTEPAAPAAGSALVERREDLGDATAPRGHDELATVLRDSVRTVVRPLGDELEQLEAGVAAAVQELSAERRARLDDLELLTELVVEGWRGVDRRLGRVEKVLARIEQNAGDTTGSVREPSVKRLEDWIQKP